MASPRIVSLIASATEVVCALGFEKNLVGRSHECDYPESVKRLPVCTQAKFPTDGTSYQIDQRVKAILQEGLSVYRVDAEQLRQLRPDLIVTQDHCAVCAVSLKDVEETLRQFIDNRPRIVSLHPNNLGDVWLDMHRVAEALGAPERGKELVLALTRRMAPIAKQAQPLSKKPRVACIEWIDPLMASGNWTPELVEIAGGQNLFGEAGQHSPELKWQDLRAADPDVILVLPCGWDIPRARLEMDVLTARPDWPQLRAVRGRQVFLLEGNQYFNRPGPRLVESLEILAEILHPQVFHFGHEGRGWERLEGD
jgi:iron complex transport system substrate-binding protein